MGDRSWTRAFLGREVWTVFALLLAVYFLPNLLFDTELLYGASPAAPVWQAATQMARTLGCGNFASCVLLALGFFLVYTYVLSVVVATLVRAAIDSSRGEL